MIANMFFGNRIIFYNCILFVIIVQIHVFVFNFCFVSREDAKEDESELMKFQSFNYDISEWKKLSKRSNRYINTIQEEKMDTKLNTFDFYFKFQQKKNDIDLLATEWVIRLSSYQKYLKQTHKEMDDLLGAPLIKGSTMNLKALQN